MALRDGEPMTLTAEDVLRLRALSDPISLQEAEQVYLPLTRLLSLYVEAIQGLHRVSHAGEEGPRLGLSVSRRVGGAVDRTKVKRVLREAFWAESERLIRARLADDGGWSEHPPTQAVPLL